MKGRRALHGSPPRRQRGIAMLVAILLVALGTILAAAVAYKSAMAARMGSATLSFDEAVLVGQGAEAFAAFGLKSIMQASKGSNGQGSGDITLGQQWATPVGPLEVVPGVTLEQLSLEDMQGRFNLNWLVAPPGTQVAPGQQVGIQIPGSSMVDPGAYKAFQHLLELVGVEPAWADKIVDWIDEDQIASSQGAEDSLYMGQSPPYLTANQYITSTTELLALPGFGHERYAKLAPYISALPPGTSLNICTAPGVVLDAFTPSKTEWSGNQNLDKTRAESMACFPNMQAYQASFSNPADFTNASAVAGGGGSGGGTGGNGGRFATTTSYFRLTSLITIGTTEFNLYSLLFMDQQGYFVHPIQRSFSPD
jgi:general secretion pathway protein K